MNDTRKMILTLLYDLEPSMFFDPRKLAVDDGEAARAYGVESRKLIEEGLAQRGLDPASGELTDDLRLTSAGYLYVREMGWKV